MRACVFTLSGKFFARLRFQPKACWLSLLLVSTLFVNACADITIAGDKMHIDNPLFAVDLGSDRADIETALHQRWRSEPVCETRRTGYGMKRRSYFLHTCTYNNASTDRLCEREVVSAAYVYLESSLVDVKLKIAGETDAALRVCLNGVLADVGFTPLAADIVAASGSVEVWSRSEPEEHRVLLQADKVLRLSQYAETQKIHFFR